MDSLVRSRRYLALLIGAASFGWGLATALLWTISSAADMHLPGALTGLVDFLNTFTGAVFRNLITLIGIGHILWMISGLVSSVRIIRIKLAAGLLAGIFVSAGLQKIIEQPVVVGGMIWGMVPLAAAYFAILDVNGLQRVILRLLISGLFLGQFAIFCFYFINNAGFALVRIMGAPMWSAILIPSLITGLVSGLALGAVCGIYSFLSVPHLAGNAPGKPKFTLVLSVVVLTGLVMSGIFINTVYGTGIHDLKGIVHNINTNYSDRVDLLLQPNGGLRRQIDGEWLNGGSIADWENSIEALKKFVAVNPTSVFRQDARMILGRLALARWDIETARNAFENYALNVAGSVTRADLYLLICDSLSGNMDALLKNGEKIWNHSSFIYPSKRLAMLYCMAAIRTGQFDMADKFLQEAEVGLTKDKYGGIRPAVGRDADLINIKENLKLKLKQSKIHGSDFSVEGKVTIKGDTSERILLGLYPMAAKNMRSRDTTPISLFPNWWTSDFILTITDDEGYYEFVNVPPGEYYLFMSVDAERLKNKTVRAPQMPILIPERDNGKSISLETIEFVNRINVISPGPSAIVYQRLPEIRWSQIGGAKYYTVILVRSNPGSLNYAGYTCWGRPYITETSLTIDRDAFWKFEDKTLNTEANARALMPGEDYTPVVFAFDKNNRLIGSSEDYTGDLTQTFMVDLTAK